MPPDFTGELPGSGAGNQADDVTVLDDPIDDDNTDPIDDGSQDPPKPGRSTDQVRGELLRKLGDMEKRYEKQLKQMQDAIPQLLTSTLESFAAKAQPTPPPGRRALSDYTLAELEAGRAAVDASNNQALKEEYHYALMVKRAEHAAESAIDKRFRADAVTQLDQRTKNLIADTYGSLGIFEEGSEFRAKFNEKLQDLDKLGLRSGPAMLGAATEAALEVGVFPNKGQTSPPRRAGSNAANGRTNAPPDDNSGVATRKAELDAALADFERNTGRKFSEKQRKEMLKDYQILHTQKPFIVKGGGF